MPVAGPWYFAWARKDERTFGPEHHRMDEYIESMKRTLAEGQKPIMEVVMKNPRVGLLNPLREFWAWFGYTDENGDVQPWFFGRVVGIPSDTQGEKITVVFVAWPEDYVRQLQLVAETLKDDDHWDPVFIDVAKRDDPDAILEAHTKHYGVHPWTLEVTADDFIQGEDGNVDVTQDEHAFLPFSTAINQPPLKTIKIEATVPWTQTARGLVDMGNRTIVTYSGDGLISDWPKPLQQLSDGWSVQYACAVDVAGVASALNSTWTYNWTNPEKHHSNGDAMTVSVNCSTPQLKGMAQGVLSAKGQNGVLDPFAVDSEGNPDPLNIPMSIDVSFIYAAVWTVNTALVLRYDAERPRVERFVTYLTADVQPTIVDPTVQQDAEVITKNGVDVGVPLISLRNWTTVYDSDVEVGDVIFPDNPSLPGTQTAQRCVTGGHTDTVQPEFSDVPGFLTNDGTAVWASLGTSSPTDNAPDWTAVSHVNAGTIIRPREPFWTTWHILTQPGRAQFPKTGVSVSEGQVIQSSNGAYHSCTQGGETNSVNSNPQEPNFGTTWGGTVTDGTVVWTCLGTTLPDGTYYYLSLNDGVTGAQYVLPPFPLAVHGTVVDGGVTWVNVGRGDIPIGGTPSNVTASSYFPRDRGARSQRYLIACARARLLYRARCAEIEFQTTFLKGMELSMRKSITMHDYRLAGGLALGMPTQIVHTVDGPTGVAKCEVQMACCVGYGNAVTEVPGSPTYASEGYVSRGYQKYENQIVLLPSTSDVGYAPIVQTVTDDGLTFPLTKSQIVITETIRGDLDAQLSAVNRAFASAAKAAQLGQSNISGGAAGQFTYVQGGFGSVSSGDYSIYTQQQQLLANADSVGFELKTHPIWYDAQIKPLNRPFNAVYVGKCTDLVVPQGMDLESEVTT